MVWTGGDYIYVLSGYSTNPNPFRRYSISGNTLTPMTYAPGKANTGSGLAYDGGDTIYALLTWSSSPAASYLYAYSISSGGWTFLANAPEQMASGSNICRVGSYLYIGGGAFPNTGQYRRWSAGGGWETLASLPSGVWGSGSGQEKVSTDFIYATKGGEGATTNNFMRYSISGNSWTYLQDTPGDVKNQNDRLAYDGTFLYMIRGFSTSSFWRYEVKTFEKVCMPDLGQHSKNWCWVAAAANSIYWYSQHGYLKLIDDPADPTMNDNRYITDQLIQHPPGCPNGGFYRLLAEIATDCGHVWDEGILNNEYFYGLQKFIDDQGVPLVVHEIVDPAHVLSPPPEDGVKVIYRPPTLEDYKRELENCQDVLLWLNYRHTSPYEDTDHVVTGVGFNYDNTLITVSDPWTPGAPDHSNDLTHTLTPYDTLTVKSTPGAPLYVSYAGQDVQVTKMVYISPAPPAVCGVEVIIENKLLEGLPCETLAYTISVHNSGTVMDNIYLSYIPDGWPDITIIPPVLIDVMPCETRRATMLVHVPDQALPSTYKEITVVAESQFCGATDNDTTQAHVTETPPVCGVEVTIENKLLEGYPSQVLAYTIDVHNSGNIVDNIHLSCIPDGWPDITIVPPMLTDVAPCEHRQATMLVHVPDGAQPSTYKEITVVAESQFCGATDNDTTQAHVTETPPVCGVEVTIENKLLEGYPSQVLAYTISVHNSGIAVDNIILSFVPDGWPDIVIIPPVLIDVMPCETRQATMLVHVPDGAQPCTYKPIEVIAESMFCHATDIDNAMAHVIEQSENFTLHLVAGWNLIGFQITNENMTPDKLFAGTTFVMYYWTAPGGPYVEPTYTLPVEDNRGYWVRENQDTTITFSGVRPSSRTMYFVAGWNLVSFPLTSANTTPDNLFAGTAFVMYYWTAPGGPYVEPTYTLPVEDNRGYWVRENQSWSVQIPIS
jgi:hypothetical protein